MLHAPVFLLTAASLLWHNLVLLGIFFRHDAGTGLWLPTYCCKEGATEAAPVGSLAETGTGGVGALARPRFKQTGVGLEWGRNCTGDDGANHEGADKGKGDQQVAYHVLLFLILADERHRCGRGAPNNRVFKRRRLLRHPLLVKLQRVLIAAADCRTFGARIVKTASKQS
jgi:hypothetical protein